MFLNFIIGILLLGDVKLLLFDDYKKKKEDERCLKFKKVNIKDIK